MTRCFYGFFHLCLNNRLSKQSSGWLFEIPSRSLWCHCNALTPEGVTLSTYLLLGKMAAISQTTFSNAFSWIYIYIFFNRNSLKSISQHWFRERLGTKQATSHYLNQCWASALTHECRTKGRWFNRQAADHERRYDFFSNVTLIIVDLCMQKWRRHQMGTFPRYWPFLARSFGVFFDPPTNGWEKDRDAVDLRRNRAHCDVNVMKK